MKSHGLYKHRLYTIHRGMKARCYDVKDADYPAYGGRGIKMCDEWRNDFMSFFNWAMANGYADNLSIDRFPDNDGDYEPGNARWATPKQQCQNRRFRTNEQLNGKFQKSLRDMSMELFGSSHTISHRLSRGWTLEKALNTPLNVNCIKKSLRNKKQSSTDAVEFFRFVAKGYEFFFRDGEVYCFPAGGLTEEAIPATELYKIFNPFRSSPAA